MPTHPKSFVGFVGLVVFCTAFINTYFIANEIEKGKTIHQKAAPTTHVLGLTEAGSNKKNHAPNRLIVRFTKNPHISYFAEVSIVLPLINKKVYLRRAGLRSKTFGSPIDNILAAQGVVGSKTIYQYNNGQTLQVMEYQGQNETGLDSFRAGWQNEPSVINVSYDYQVHSLWTPDDPGYGLQWELNTAVGNNQINMPLAWDIIIDPAVPSNTIGVAVMDTGIAYENFTDLYPSNCSDNAGCVDPNAQYALHPDMDSGLFLPGFDMFDDPVYAANPHPNDDNGHGTHVSSTIAQIANNDNRFSGMANVSGSSRIKLMPIKVLDRNSAGYASYQVAGFDYIKNYNATHNPKIKVINLSLGGEGRYQDVQDIINELYGQGVTIIASSGNSAVEVGGECMMYPAAFDHVVSIGATRYDRQRAVYSCYQEGLDLVAPGGQMGLENTCYLPPFYWPCSSFDQSGDGWADGIWQTTIVGRPESPPPSDNIFTAFTPVDNCLRDYTCGLYQGTSMAAPHVTALAALMYSINPNLTPDEVETILKNTANKNIPGYNTAEYGAGLIDAAAALSAVIADLPGVTGTPTPTNTPQPTYTPTPTKTPTPTPSPTNTPGPSATPTATPTINPSCREDVSGDGLVNLTDLNRVLASNSWGQTCSGCREDTDLNGSINLEDVKFVIRSTRWNNACN